MTQRPMPPPRTSGAGAHRKLLRLQLAVGVIVLAIVAAGLTWWWNSQQQQRNWLMTYGSVQQSTTKDGRTQLTVGYQAGGRRHTVTGDVDPAAFAFGGRTVWVCYAVDDPATARLRLPTDPLCEQR
ncbi:hypothetical protein G9U51_07650 [Calidifontibacter sp. DB0510]|uniref:DUF3592 domain-containing protein n=1 Tax=Metallococcus carri TaxID=1656884 RepID=A0A967EGX6_9MICO|nr:hypothetical protein [Metallococcus carri]NHN55653.1 hypothetical protein [Metallococcus carri]NOP38163.1 hypothetical protein [Calidifontibacter sp. DB2511S]